jgi:hypothetical protein
MCSVMTSLMFSSEVIHDVGVRTYWQLTCCLIHLTVKPHVLHVACSCLYTPCGWYVALLLASI